MRDEIVLVQILKALYDRPNEDDENTYENTLIQFFEAPHDTGTLTAFVSTSVALQALSSSLSETASFTAAVTSSILDPTALRWGGHSHSELGPGANIKLPSLTARAIEMRVYINSSQPDAGWHYLMDARTGLPNGHFADQKIGANWTNGKMYVNGGSFPVSWANIPKDQWINLYLEADIGFTDDITIGSRFSDVEYLRGSLDYIRVYNRPLDQMEIIANLNGEVTQNGLVRQFDYSQSTLSNWFWGYGGVWK